MGNRRVIFILLGGIAACLALLWCADLRDVQFAERARNASVLVGHPLAALDRLVVERGDLYVEVRRQRHGWEMHAPFAAQVDQGAVARLLDVVEGARVSDTIRFSEMKHRDLALKDFGFAPPAARLTLQGGGWATTLLIGAPTPTGREVFVRDVNSEAIWSVPAEVASLLPAAVDEWRLRDIATSDRARLRVMEIKAPGRPFIRLSKETGTWRLLQPVDGPADDRKVDALLDALYAAKAVRFAWPSVRNLTDLLATESALKSRMEVYGLGADVALQVTVQEAAGAEPSRIVFGNRSDGEDALRYVLMPGGNTVAAVSNAVFEAFQCTPSDLRDTRLFSESPERVKRLKVGQGAALFVLSQNDALWQMESPVAMRMDTGRFTAALKQFLSLTAETLSEQTDDRMLPEGFALLPFETQVELQTDANARAMAFIAEDAARQSYRVEMADTPVAYHVAASNVPPAFLDGAAMLDLCDKTVLSLTNDAIRRVTVKRPDGTAESVQREGGAAPDWRAVGEAREVDADALGAFIKTMSALAVERFELPLAVQAALVPSRYSIVTVPLPDYGLKSPWLEITLGVDAADAIRKTLIIGAEAHDGGRHATIRGQDIVFVLQPETVAVLHRPLLKE